MPILRYRGPDGKVTEWLLDVRAGGEGQTAPLTLGADPAAGHHLHLPRADQPVTATIVGSSVSSAYTFVIHGDEILVNDRPLDPLRVLRHGDMVQAGGGRFLYLDFLPRRLAAGSPLLAQSCALPDCTKPWKANVPVVACPWCGRPYHATCWMRLKHCATQGCYPVRYVLLEALAKHVKIEHLAETTDNNRRVCAARCAINEPIQIQQEIIRCTNPRCRATYHPECWLSWRGSCPECETDIYGLIRREVFCAEREDDL